jgi:hypothetical protein
MFYLHHKQTIFNKANTIYDAFLFKYKKKLLKNLFLNGIRKQNHTWT